MAQQACEHIDGCPMFKYFCSIAKHIYADIYCRSNPEICERRKRRAAGKGSSSKSGAKSGTRKRKTTKTAAAAGDADG